MAFLLLLLLGLTGRGFAEFDFVGGVGAYIAWSYMAGTIGGLTVGALRRHTVSPFGVRFISGLVTVGGFATQFFVFATMPLGEPTNVFLLLVVLAWDGQWDRLRPTASERAGQISTTY